MNVIKKNHVSSLGYNFIDEKYLPKGKDEYHLRNLQNRNGVSYRQLSAYEIEVLVRNRNQSDNWNSILVSDAFTPELVKNCKFYGLIRIGKLEPYFLEFNNLRIPVGLYNSTIISCDLGDNVAIDNVNYMSHYIIGNDVILVNINELATTNYAKFGNGILKEGESENIRIWMEVCNENGGRSIIPFNGMLPGDAYLWTRFRDDEVLQKQFLAFTEKNFDKQRGYYGKIGDRTVIKNTRIMKDVWIGSDAYIKGANKLKNLTINSQPDAKSQIGEGCELVNGIMGEGCKAFYGVKAVRFIMASNSQLKYGARLINSYLGNNATISCCEVLNSLIFPAHEQHHNNSFLCASLILGQSNIAAGATIGSNHNSRSADGELIAGRGFWPGLCVSLKHNSKFASFNILAKGDYPAELNIPFPFALVSNDVSKDQLQIMPCYWFMYNIYALARNAWKYTDRDKRIEKVQFLESDFLAPDSVNEILKSLELLKLFTGKAYQRQYPSALKNTEKEIIKVGETLLEQDNKVIDELEVIADAVENSDRKVVITKVRNAYHLYKELIQYYTSLQLVELIKKSKTTIADLTGNLPAVPASVANWSNIGGQLIAEPALKKFLQDIKTNKIKSWDQVHLFYKTQGDKYPVDKLQHALSVYRQAFGVDIRKDFPKNLKQLLAASIKTKEWMTKNIYDSRAKDYSNPFRKMVYENDTEMEKVTGKLSENSFILQELENLKLYKQMIQGIFRKYKL